MEGKLRGKKMLGIAELKRRAAKEGVPQGTIEKDFVLSVALKSLAESDLSNRVVFKGGTAIRKMYFKEARFSEDLDFTVPDYKEVELVPELKNVLGGKVIEGIQFGKLEEEKTSAGLKVTVKCRGPLMHEQRIRFDFSFRENLVEKPIRKPLIDLYEIGEHELSVLAIEEILAEKVHALGSRTAPRDLYDIWYLLNKGVKLNKELIERKFSYYNEKLDKNKIESNVQLSQKDWKRDLKRLVKDLPEYEKVAREIKVKMQWA